MSLGRPSVRVSYSLALSHTPATKMSCSVNARERTGTIGLNVMGVWFIPQISSLLNQFGQLEISYPDKLPKHTWLCGVFYKYILVHLVSFVYSFVTHGFILSSYPIDKTCKAYMAQASQSQHFKYQHAESLSKPSTVQ